MQSCEQFKKVTSGYDGTNGIPYVVCECNDGYVLNPENNCELPIIKFDITKNSSNIILNYDIVSKGRTCNNITNKLTTKYPDVNCSGVSKLTFTSTESISEIKQQFNDNLSGVFNITFGEEQELF